MWAMPRHRPPYLHRYYTRHKKAVWYVRRPQGPKIRIRAAFGTPEFDSEYQAAICGVVQMPRQHKALSGSLAWLWDRYRETDAWKHLAPGTRRARENIMSHVLKAVGQDPFASFRRADIVASRDARSDTPAQARNFLDLMRGLFR